MPAPGLYGRKAPDRSRPRMFIDRYFTGAALALPPFNPTAHYTVPSWPMYMNGPDPAMPPGVPTAGLGCCTASYIGHSVQAVTASAGGEVTPANTDILAAYCGYGGYVVGDETTDQGAEIQVMLQWWRNNPVAGQQIAGFGELERITPQTLNAALTIARTVCLGVNLPQSAEDQFGEDKPWTPVRGSQIAGGHCIGLQGFKPTGAMLEPVTWGALWSMSQAFSRDYTEEAWVPLFPQVIAAERTSGLVDWDAFAADFTALTGDPFPAAA